MVRRSDGSPQRPFALATDFHSDKKTKINKLHLVDKSSKNQLPKT
jgi:hypothetical protein